jgi:shikimate dehydrogenase
MSEAPVRRGAAVLGSPIAHSLSPVLHRAAYDALGLDDWSYRAIECAEADLADTLRSLDAEGLAGVSLTMPLKRAVMALLSYGGDYAIAVNAANTVLFSDDAGNWLGANTDVPAMTTVLREANALAGDVGDVGDAGGVPCVLGGGATAGSALAGLAGAGYSSAVIVARRPEATTELAAIADRVGLSIEVHPWSEILAAVRAPLVIATTPAGSTDDVAGEIRTVKGLLFDVVYSPWPTALAQRWESAGGRVVGGMELLVEQAVLQVTYMTGHTPPAAEMRRAGYAALGTRA